MVDHARGGVETRGGDPPHADLAVVVRHVREQAVDRVVGVGALVDVLRSRLLLDVRSHVDEDAFREVAAAHVLVDDDEAVAHREFGRTDGLLRLVRSIRSDAVGRTAHEDRVLLRSVLRRVDRGEELRTVAHRDAHLALVVVLARVAAGFRRLRCRRRLRSRRRLRRRCGHRRRSRCRSLRAGSGARTEGESEDTQEKRVSHGVIPFVRPAQLRARRARRRRARASR